MPGSKNNGIHQARLFQISGKSETQGRAPMTGSDNSDVLNPSGRAASGSVPELTWDVLRCAALEAGADDVGVVSIDRPEVAEEWPHVLAAFPQTRSLLSLVARSNADAIRSPARSIGNLEFHRNYHHLNDVQWRIVDALRRMGVRAVSPSSGFPMEMDDFPGRIWVVSHKTVAVAAGLGQMGIHRNVIHPVFGSFIHLGTILVAAEVTGAESAPIDFNPCLECKLCVAACPVGAISPDGHFNFQSCYTHNYRELMGGFAHWAETLAGSRTARHLRSRIGDEEQTSLWQSLAFGANYKAAYCIAVCPAGEYVIAPYREDRAAFQKAVLKPLQKKREKVYVIKGGDAEDYVARRYPHKSARCVPNTLRPRTIAGFLDGLPLVFQRSKAKDLAATYHFKFTGTETAAATIVIEGRELSVAEGHQGRADLTVTADSDAWLAFLRKDLGLPWMLLTRKLRLKGPPRLMTAFGRCFPN